MIYYPNWWNPHVFPLPGHPASSEISPSHAGARRAGEAETGRGPEGATRWEFSMGKAWISGENHGKNHGKRDGIEINPGKWWIPSHPESWKSWNPGWKEMENHEEFHFVQWSFFDRDWRPSMKHMWIQVADEWMENYNPEIIWNYGRLFYRGLCMVMLLYFSILFIDEGRCESLSNDCPIDFWHCHSGRNAQNGWFF